MRATRRYVMGGLVTVATAAIGISIASPALADPTNCQQVGATTVCGQGSVHGGAHSPGGSNPQVPAPTGGGCTNAYGAYQNCNSH
jgi:hypothetical protein